MHAYYALVVLVVVAGSASHGTSPGPQPQRFASVAHHLSSCRSRQVLARFQECVSLAAPGSITVCKNAEVWRPRGLVYKRPIALYVYPAVDSYFIPNSIESLCNAIASGAVARVHAQSVMAAVVSPGHSLVASR